MVSKRRRKNTSAVEGLLLKEFHRFDFFQAVRLLEMLHPYAAGLGEGSNPGQEAVNFSARVGLEFPASGIYDLGAGRAASGFILTENALDEIAEREIAPPESLANLKGLLDHRFTRREFRGRLRQALTTQDADVVRRIMRLATRSEPHRMQVTFLGLAGAFGPLPVPYTELIMDRLKDRDGALADFLDIFNHRLISIYYRVRKNFRAGFTVRSPEQDPLSRKLLSLTGAGREFQRDELSRQERSRLGYVGLFSRRPRSSRGLRTLLAGLWKVPVEVEDWVGAWGRIDPGQQSRIGAGPAAANHLLGRRPGPEFPVHLEPPGQAVLGRRLWDQQSAFRLHLGPMDYPRFADFLPTGPSYRDLVDMARGYAGHEFDFGLRLRLKPEQIRPARLLNIWNYEIRFTGSELARLTLAGPRKSGQWDAARRSWRYLPPKKIDALMEMRDVPFDNETEFREALEERIGRSAARKFHDIIFQFSDEQKIKTPAYRLTPRVIERLVAEIQDERFVPRLLSVASAMPQAGFRSAEELTRALEERLDPELLRPYLPRILQGALRLENKAYYTRDQYLDALDFTVARDREGPAGKPGFGEHLQEGVLDGSRLGWNSWLRTGEYETTYRLTRSSLRRLRAALPNPDQAVMLEPLVDRVYASREIFLSKMGLMLGHQDWDRLLLYHAITDLRDRPESFRFTPRAFERLEQFIPEHLLRRLRVLADRTFEGRESFLAALEKVFRVDRMTHTDHLRLLRRLSGRRGKQLRRLAGAGGTRKQSRSGASDNRRGGRLRRILHRRKSSKGDMIELKRFRDQILNLTRRRSLYQFSQGFRLTFENLARLRSRIPADLADRIEQAPVTRHLEHQTLLNRTFRNEQEYLGAMRREVGGYNVLLYRDELLAAGRRELNNIPRFGFTRQALDRLREELPRGAFAVLEKRIQGLRYLEYADEDELLAELIDSQSEPVVRRYRERVVHRALRDPENPTVHLSCDFKGPPVLRADDHNGLTQGGIGPHG